MKNFNWDLYLVTEEKLSKGRDTLEVVKKAIVGGIDVIQMREKGLDLKTRYKIGKNIREITRKENVIFIVNDRVDLALALEADGVHLGQSDLPLTEAKKLLGDEYIIGKSASTKREAIEAEKNGADYLGIGAIYRTDSKEETKYKEGIGCDGLKKIREKSSLPLIAIGGIKPDNSKKIIKSGADTISVITAISRAENIKEQTSKFKEKIKNHKDKYKNFNGRINKMDNKFYNSFQNIINWINKDKPLIHHITNNVTVNDCANITLNWGGLPVMAPGAKEAAEMVESASALVLNIGTIHDSQLEAMLKAGKKANKLNIPIILDPVGTGATFYRTEAVRKILKKLNISVIKGNKGEISILAGETGEVKGVESVGEYNDIQKSAAKLAKDNKCVVVVSGKKDFITNGEKLLTIERGHFLMGELVGTGCMLSSTLGVFVAKNNNLKLKTLEKVKTAVVAYGLAGEKAAFDISTPNYFKIEFMDTIYRLAKNKIDIKTIKK